MMNTIDFELLTRPSPRPSRKKTKPGSNKSTICFGQSFRMFLAPMLGAINVRLARVYKS
jgi:hypothetical protein